MKPMRTSALAVLAALIVPAAAVAAAPQQPAGSQEIADLAEWDAETLYAGGMSVDHIRDEMAVYGPAGTEIGDIRDIVFSREGRLLSLVAEVGGFRDVLETIVNVPWEEVTYAQGRFTIPVTEEKLEDYSVFDTGYLVAPDAAADPEVVERDIAVVESEMAAGPRAFRASELIGDYARIREAGTYVIYGYVSDLIIQDGKVAAVVVNPDGRYGVTGPYAYPYTGHRWSPGSPYYDMPYGRPEVIEVDRLDYGRFEQN